LNNAPHLLKLQRLKVAQPVFYGCGIDLRRLRPGSLGQWIIPHVTHRRQGDLAGPRQHQEQATAHHFA